MEKTLVIIILASFVLSVWLMVKKDRTEYFEFFKNSTYN